MLFSPIFLSGFTLIFIASLSSALWYRLLWSVASDVKKRRRYKVRFLVSLCISISVIGSFKQGASIAFSHDASLLGFTLLQESRYVPDGDTYAPVPWDNAQISFPDALRHARALVVSEQHRAWEEYRCHVKNERFSGKENFAEPGLRFSACTAGVH